MQQAYLVYSASKSTLLVFSGSGRVSARQPPYFLRKKVGKEPAPTAPDPPASPAGNLRRQPLAAARQNSLRASLCVQTRCRKSDNDAVALCGATASPKSLPSQAGSEGAIPG